MCGRYSQTQTPAALAKRFGLEGPPPALTPRFNIAPSQDAPVILEDGGRRLALLRWGLIPAWAKDPAIGHKLINARAETLREKPSYQRPFQTTRCLVLADGFYEWRRPAKTPVRVVLRSGEPFAMAGLWDQWRSPGGETIRSFSIVTTQASDVLRPIHDRMPVILRPQDEAAWLDPDSEPASLSELLRPSARELRAYDVSPRVNSPAYDAPDCAEPVPSAELFLFD